MDATGTANVFEAGEQTLPVDAFGVGSFTASGVSGPHKVDIDVIARDTAVSNAFGRFDMHLQSPACELQGMYTPSAVG